MPYSEFIKNITHPKQLIRLIVLAICICITIYQLAECITKIKHPPISTYYKFRLNETIKYPSLTVCRKPAYKSDLFPKFGIETIENDLMYKHAFLKFPFGNYTIQDFLDQTTFFSNETIPMYGFKGTGFGTLKMESNYFIEKGLCHTFTPIENSNKFSEDGGYLLFFTHDVKEKMRNIYGIATSGYDIFMHDSKEVFTGESTENNFMEYLFLESGEDVKVSLKLQIFRQISSKDKPCNSDPEYSKSKCREMCIHEQIAEKVGCILPWLRVNNYPQCSNFSAVQALISGFNEGNITNFQKNCRCKVPCKLTIFSSHIQSRRESSLMSESVINVYFPTNLITQMEEVSGYDWNLFLSDIGGSLGFLLGLSVIGAISVLEKIVQHIFFSTPKI